MKKNKIANILIIFAMVLSVCFFVGCGEDEDQKTEVNIDSQGIEYELTENGKGYNIIKYTQQNGIKSIAIPKEYKSKPVTSVSASVFANQTKIESVVLGENIVTIGNSAFKGCTALKEITFSDSVETVGESAFENTAVETVMFGQNVKKIGKGAFKSCSKLMGVAFSQNLETIGKDAFNGDSLATVTISSSIKKVGEDCFANNPYLNYIVIQNEEIDVDELTEAFGDDLSISKLSTPSKYLTCFNNFSVQDLEVTSGTNIASGLFQGKSSLKTVKLCSDITKIGNNSFKNCNNITTLSCDASVLNSFGCSKIKALTITSGTSIENDTFNEASNLKALSICNTVTEIGENCFNGGHIETLSCSQELLKYFIPADIVSLSITSGQKLKKSEFLYMTNLERLSIADTIWEIEENAFSYCTKLEYSEDDNARYIGNWLVTVTNKAVEDLSTNNNMMVVNNALKGCNNLKKLALNNLPNQLGMLFGGSISPVLEELNISSGKLVADALKDVKSLKYVEFQNITEFGDCALFGCENLETITMYSDIEKLGENVFDGCPKLEYEEYENGNYISNVFINLVDVQTTVAQVKDGTKFIYNNAFYGCENLKQVFLPKTVTSVGENIFDGCDKDLKIYIQDINGKTLKKSNPYWNYVNAEIELTVYTNVECYDSYMFFVNGNCCTILGYLEETAILYFPDELNGKIVTEIAPYAFYGRQDIETLIFSQNIEVVDAYAFYGCKGIDNLMLSNKIKYINHYAFYGCEKIESIDLYSNLVEIGNFAFVGCSSLNFVFTNQVELVAINGEEEINLTQLAESELAQYMCENSCKFVNIFDGEIEE